MHRQSPVNAIKTSAMNHRKSHRYECTPLLLDEPMLLVRIRRSAPKSNPKLVEKEGQIYAQKHTVVVVNTNPLYLVTHILNLDQETLVDPRSLAFVMQYIMKHVPSLEVNCTNTIVTATEGHHTHRSVQIHVDRAKATIWI